MWSESVLTDFRQSADRYFRKEVTRVTNICSKHPQLTAQLTELVADRRLQSMRLLDSLLNGQNQLYLFVLQEQALHSELRYWEILRQADDRIDPVRMCARMQNIIEQEVGFDFIQLTDFLTTFLSLRGRWVIVRYMVECGNLREADEHARVHIRALDKLLEE
ncbi:MAG: hypothetical protein EOO17_02460 [Chloroflexi bacterium]|nr:MAG: hypothetical protein EOO17_02460 [Chloroflexota bacterium]